MLFRSTFDYGFSKSRTEATAKWGERETLADIVRAIRLFRPLVVYARFSGSPADGHGHHQMSGYLTPIAFKAAADPTQFPEQLQEGLRPWQARKLYRGSRNDPGPVLQVQTGVFDPLIGRTYAEVSFEGRSQHKTQAQGGIEPRGPQASPLLWIGGSEQPRATEQSIFDGIDTTVPGLAGLVGLPDGTIRGELGAMAAAARDALAQYDPQQPDRKSTRLNSSHT